MTAAVLERTIGLREDEETIVEGFDPRESDIVHDAPSQPAAVGAAAATDAGAVPAGTRGNGAETAAVAERRER